MSDKNNKDKIKCRIFAFIKKNIKGKKDEQFSYKENNSHVSCGLFCPGNIMLTFLSYKN